MSMTHCAVSNGNFSFDWNDRHIELSGAQLRQHCRCAECRYQQLTGVEKNNNAEVSVLAASPLGYGVQLHFSDGHNRGVFPWSYLVEIAEMRDDVTIS